MRHGFDGRNMKEYRFQAQLEKPDLRGAWTFVRIPFSVAEEFGVKGQVPVKGTINGIPYENSLLPQGGDIHILVIKKDIREKAGVTDGDVADILLERVSGSREVEVPPELAKALKDCPAAESLFESLAYSHRKAYCDHVAQAKRADTRARRAKKCVELLVEAAEGDFKPGFRRSPS